MVVSLWQTSSRDSAKHGAAIFVYRFHGGVEDVFKTRQLRHSFLEWSAQHLMRCALRDDAALFHDQHAFAERQHFFARVRDI